MQLSDLNIFNKTAELGSISKAARFLDMTPATASAAIKRLEQQLGTELFIRSTRSLRLSEAGAQFLEFSRQALDYLEQGRRAILPTQGNIAESLRLAAPSDLGRNVILGWLQEFLDRYPLVHIHLQLSDNLVDFYQDRVHAVLRYGGHKDSNLVAFKMMATERVLVASPQYLDSQGHPSKFSDLVNHRCLIYQLNGKPYDQWNLAGTKYPVSFRLSSDDGDVIKKWCLSGLGIAYKSYLDVYQNIVDGSLHRLFPGVILEHLDLYFICSSRKQVTPALRLLRDFLLDKFKNFLKVIPLLATFPSLIDVLTCVQTNGWSQLLF